MKKTLLLITAALLLTGCAQVDDEIFTWPFVFDGSDLAIEIPLTEECEQSYTQDNISFNYQCDWEIYSNDPIVLTYHDKTPPGRITHVKLPAESFAEYEDIHKDQIQSDFMGMSVREDQLTINNITYPIKEYGEHGGITYLLEIDGNYIEFGSEFALNEKELRALYIILSSISF